MCVGPGAASYELKKRMGWQLVPWYTITDDFDADFDVDQWHGHNAFYRDDDDRIYVGAWTRLVLRRATDSEVVVLEPGDWFDIPE